MNQKHPLSRIIPDRIPGPRLGKNAYVFLVCLGISSLFWLLNAFSKSYTQVVNFPVRYENLPEDLVLLNEPPSQIGVEVSGFGFNLLNAEGNIKDTLVVDGKALKKRQIGQRQEAIFPTRSLRGQASAALSSNLKVQSFARDSLFFEWEAKATKLVPVQPNIEVSFARQYMQDGKIVLKPTAVQLSGPSSILDTIQGVVTEPIRLEDLSQTEDLYAKLSVPGAKQGVRAQPAEAQITIPVDEYTEDTLSIPIRVENLPDSLRIRTFPDHAQVTYRVALNKYERVRNLRDQFHLAIDYLDIEQNVTGKLKLRMVRNPEAAEVVRMQPERVEYLVRK